MRKIKFRVWDKNKNTMYVNDVNVIIEACSGAPMWTFGYDAPLHMHDCEVMQFTSLTDKNGTEIYEGDILSIDFGCFVPNHKHVVEWSDELGRFQGRVIEENEHSEYHQNRLYAFHPSIICEIIGNIYENPALLGKKEAAPKDGPISLKAR